MRRKPLQSLTKRRDFDAVFKEGTSAASSSFVIYARPTALSFSRLGLAVSKKIGNAVIRNKIRRLLREAMRGLVNNMPQQYDFVIIARKPAVTGTLDEFMISIEQFLCKVNTCEKSS